jgi:ketosteroid isomerase-like protein
MTGRGEQEDTPVRAVLELYAAIRDRRIADVLALTAPEVTCEPLVRPGLAVYEGHDGMTRLVSDLHAVHGDYQVAIVEVTEQPGPQVTVVARLVPEPGRGRPVPVRSVYTFRDGLITSIESFPAGQDAVSPPHPEDDAPGG